MRRYQSISETRKKESIRLPFPAKGNKLGWSEISPMCRIWALSPPCIVHVASRIMTWSLPEAGLTGRKKGKKCLWADFGPISSCLFLPSAGLFRLLKSIRLSISLWPLPSCVPCLVLRQRSPIDSLSFSLALHQTMCWATRLRVTRVRRNAQSVNCCLWLRGTPAAKSS